MPPMDPVTAHIDRGWELIEKGDLKGAEKAARQVLEQAKPEAHTLLGAVASARGEPEEAMDHFRKAMDADPEYLDPVLYAAELCMGPLGDLDEAERLAEQALELAEEEDEYVDALLLRAEVALLADDDEAAAAAMGELPEEVPLPDASYEMRAGHLWLELGELEQAEKRLRAALAADDTLADAWHGLGLVHEQAGREDDRTAAMLRVRELDLAAPDEAWALPAGEVARITEEQLGKLPDVFRERLTNVPIQIDEYPSEELIKDGLDPRLLGVFSGTSITEKSSMGPAGVDVIVLFRRNIHRVAHTAEEAQEELRVTILHETGHFFGLDEEGLAELGLD